MQIRLRLILPTVLKFFKDTTTAFRETSITYFSLISQRLSLSRDNRLFHFWRRYTSYSFITLTMIISTNIKTSMSLPIVPFEITVLSLDKSFRRFTVLLMTNIRQYPTT